MFSWCPTVEVVCVPPSVFVCVLVCKTLCSDLFITYPSVSGCSLLCSIVVMLLHREGPDTEHSSWLGVGLLQKLEFETKAT